MNSDINLLTKEEKVEQFKTKAIKFSSIISIVLFVLVAGVSAYFYFKVADLKKQIEVEESRIEKARSEIKGMASTEIVARNLYKKYQALSGILNSRLYYSDLLADFNSRIPEGVEVTSFSFEGPSELSVSGRASNYLLVSEFLANLNKQEVLDPSINESTPSASKTPIFKTAYLNSVTLNSNDSTVDYVISITYNGEALKKGF
ncbi:hypothetical protein GF360_03765 [candidate division WWE3 bacterium]|nr:hypothetical protein [candidate division WWE3 bacterium]